MSIQKQILSIEEQVLHLKAKGVLFNIINEEEAKEYLRNNNNYFKLASYRKNYSKHPDGINKGKYVNLEFAYLVDLARIDMHLRYLLIHMALDIEHHVKLELVNMSVNQKEDGYKIIKEYENSLDSSQRAIYENEIARNKNNIYCGELISKYENNIPIWVYVEIIPFGRLVSFYKFCSERYSDNFMKDKYYRLLMCKELRNAVAHNNCIINNLFTNTAQHKTNSAVTRELQKINSLTPSFRKLRMSNARMQQIITMFYTYKEMVSSNGLMENKIVELNEFVKRIDRSYFNYKTNSLIGNSFDFLKIIISNWFSEKRNDNLC